MSFGNIGKPPLCRYTLGEKGISAELQHYVTFLALLVVGICAFPRIEQSQPNRRAISCTLVGVTFGPGLPIHAWSFSVPMCGATAATAPRHCFALLCFALLSILQSSHKS